MVACIRIGLCASALVAAGLAHAAPAAPLPLTVPDREVPLPVPRPPLLGAEMQGPPMPPRPVRPAVVAPTAPKPPGATAPAPPPVTVAVPAPAPATTPAAQPSPPVADQSCTAQLKAAGAVFEPVVLGRQPEAACVIAEPVKLTGFDPANGLPVDFPDRPTLACQTARVFTDFLGTLLLPYARGQFGNAITAVGTGPGFECRTRDHIPGAKISAHGQGLAVDIAEITLTNGRQLDIGKPKDESERGFDKGARAAACGFFHTALGPGADSFHETHWHFDLQPRGKSGDARICQ